MTTPSGTISLNAHVLTEIKNKTLSANSTDTLDDEYVWTPNPFYNTNTVNLGSFWLRAFSTTNLTGPTGTIRLSELRNKNFINTFGLMFKPHTGYGKYYVAYSIFNGFNKNPGINLNSTALVGTTEAGYSIWGWRNNPNYPIILGMQISKVTEKYTYSTDVLSIASSEHNYAERHSVGSFGNSSTAVIACGNGLTNLNYPVTYTTSLKFNYQTNAWSPTNGGLGIGEGTIDMACGSNATYAMMVGGDVTSKIDRTLALSNSKKIKYYSYSGDTWTSSTKTQAFNSSNIGLSGPSYFYSVCGEQTRNTPLSVAWRHDWGKGTYQSATGLTYSTGQIINGSGMSFGTGYNKGIIAGGLNQPNPSGVFFTQTFNFDVGTTTNSTSAQTDTYSINKNIDQNSSTTNLPGGWA